MSLSSILKSPTMAGVAGATGTGAVGTGMGVGGWQIYEGVNPTLHRQLLSSEYAPEGPMEVPLEPAEDVGQQDNITPHTRWNCVQKLFPQVDIHYNHLELINTSPKISAREFSYLFSYTPSNSPSPTVLFPSTYNIRNNFVTCAMLDIREASLHGSDSKNNIHIKSEVVAKGKDYGWILWSTISTTPHNKNRMHEYRFITFRRNSLDNKWIQDKVYFWNRNSASAYNISTYPRDEFHLNVIKPKNQQWEEDSWSTSEGYVYRKTWTGIGVGKTDPLHGATGQSVNWVTCNQWFAARRSYIQASDENVRELCYVKL